MNGGEVMEKAAVIFFLIILLLTGCAPVAKNPTSITYPGIQITYPYTEQEYRLQVGDQLDIKFFFFKGKYILSIYGIGK
jgi:hypothetical protein